MNQLSRTLAPDAIASRPRIADSETKPARTLLPMALNLMSLGGLLLGGSLLLTPAAQAVRACPEVQSVADFVANGACQAPDRDGNPGGGDKIFTINSALTSSASAWRQGIISIGNAPVEAYSDLYTLGYQRIGNLPWAANSNRFTLAYTIEIAPEAINDFQLSSLNFSSIVSPAGIRSTSRVWTDNFNGSSPLLGTPLTISNTGASATVPIANFPSITKLYVLNTIERTNSSGNITFFNNEFRQREIPEPSMILGILAVAGIGAASRFRHK